METDDISRKFNTLTDLTAYFKDDNTCKEYLIMKRFPDGDFICPFCGRHHCYRRSDGAFRCPDCKKNFSILVGTIFANTKISLVKWFIAMYLISSHKKGISSHQLSRDIHVTQKTAWFILHKIRTLFKQDKSIILSGRVECDEMYLGGREKNKHAIKKMSKTQGRSTKTKTPVFGMTMVWKTADVNRQTGEVKKKTHTYEVAMRVPDTKATTLIPIIEHYVAEGSTIVTDEFEAYKKLSDKYNHIVVRHNRKEFAVGSLSTNGIEGFWAHFKRMVFGTYHFVKKSYLDRYIDEAVFRFNTKEKNESDRFLLMFEKSIGKCQYKDVKKIA